MTVQPLLAHGGRFRVRLRELLPGHGLYNPYDWVIKVNLDMPAETER